MKKMGIIYGSSTGTCESIAQTIAEKLGVASVDVIDASKITTEKVEGYDILLLGTSTWGDGELQDDWYDAIKMIRTADLNGKIVALSLAVEIQNPIVIHFVTVWELYMTS